MHILELLYATEEVKKQCTDEKRAKKLFGGDDQLVEKLKARIQFLESAISFKDVIQFPPHHFHALKDKGRSKLKGYFAIDVKGRGDPWRLIIQPLDENRKPFDPCNIDEIAEIVRIVRIEKVSKHYE